MVFPHAIAFRIYSDSLISNPFLKLPFIFAMRKDGAIDQAQSILSDFVKYVEEGQLLDMDVLIREMKELVHAYEAK